MSGFSKAALIVSEVKVLGCRGTALSVSHSNLSEKRRGNDCFSDSCVWEPPGVPSKHVRRWVTLTTADFFTAALCYVILQQI